MENPSHSDIVREIHSYQQQDARAHERIDVALDRIHVLLHGKNGADGGIIRDMVQIKVTMKIGVWLVATLGAAVIAALVGIFFRLAGQI